MIGLPSSVIIARVAGGDKKIAAVLGFDWTRFYDEAEAGEGDST